jgi:hypothetical protein
MVVVYFWALSYFGLTQIGWMNYVAGTLLIGLGIWQYFSGHDHTPPNHDDDHPITTRAMTMITVTLTTTVTTIAQAGSLGLGR